MTRYFTQDQERRFLGAFAKLRKGTVSYVVYVCPSSWNKTAPVGRILMKLGIYAVFENAFCLVVTYFFYIIS